MTLVIHTDGGSRSNPGNAGIGVSMARNGVIVAEISEFLGVQTNNYAEYTAVIRALETCIEKGWAGESLEFLLDSKLVVEQVQGHWKIKEPSLKPLAARVRELAARFPSVSYTHIPREENADADRLANEAMDNGGTSKNGI
jgi:probable phosphoglycerate mutase